MDDITMHGDSELSDVMFNDEWSYDAMLACETREELRELVGPGGLDYKYTTHQWCELVADWEFYLRGYPSRSG